jgi:hypothetical protein
MIVEERRKNKNDKKAKSKYNKYKRGGSNRCKSNQREEDQH